MDCWMDSVSCTGSGRWDDSDICFATIKVDPIDLGGKIDRLYPHLYGDVLYSLWSRDCRKRISSYRVGSFDLDLGCRYRLSGVDRKSTRLNSSHVAISYAVFCLKKKKT